MVGGNPKVLIALTLLLGGCTYPIPSMERIELPSHLDTSALDNDVKHAVNEAALAWFDATDGGVDLLTVSGKAVRVTTGNLIPERVGQTNLWPDSADIVLDLKKIELLFGQGALDKTREVAMHEIGHLLLGAQHSATGLMAPNSNASCIDVEILDEVCSYHKCGPNAHPTCNH